MKKHKSFFRAANIFLLVGIFAACAPSAPALTAEIPPAAPAISTSYASSTREALPALTDVPRTPPALPSMYQSENLNPLDTPRAYIQDTCQYLKNKWNPDGAEPGTVVMILMFNGIYRGMVETPDGMDVNDLRKVMAELKKQQFDAITTKQFLAFMERNVKIPRRSVLIIQDGRHKRENFDKNFRDYWDGWRWPIVNGWASQADTPEKLWLDNIALENEGFVDHQAQGVQVGTYMTEDTSKAVIDRELEGSLKAFAERYGKTPIAFIWPSGGFGQRPVEAARQLGYQLGFTANSRGPVMFNWVPQADKEDEYRPAYIPEGHIKDPLMTLPRYWPHQMMEAIDFVRMMGNEARDYALANKAIEFEYYDIVCAPTYGPMPTP